MTPWDVLERVHLVEREWWGSDVEIATRQAPPDERAAAKRLFEGGIFDVSGYDLFLLAHLTDGKPGDGGNDEDHEPDEPDPNGV